jgi:hypothetical protein
MGRSRSKVVSSSAAKNGRARRWLLDPAEIANQPRNVLGGLVQAVKKGDLAQVEALVARNAALNMKSSAIGRRLGAEACS